MRLRFGNRLQFIPGFFKESSEELFNLGCGWFHVYTFQAEFSEGKSVKDEVWLDELCQKEHLALVLIDIGAFQYAPFSLSALDHISQIMEFFQQNQKQLILRFAYDIEGKGKEHDPISISTIKNHMEQLGPILEPYLTNILVIQGIFVGSWGEMHDSKFLDESSMVELINTLYRITQGRCYLAVRTPAQWRKIANNSKLNSKCLNRLSLFNDGIFGSPTDLGTYASLPGQEKWMRNEELEWQDTHLERVLNGGEVLSCYPLKTYKQACVDFQKMHLSYLNRIYHPKQLDFWKEEVINQPNGWQGVNGYDYIGRHLGYRFSVIDVDKIFGKRLRVTIQNTGFSNLCFEAECLLGIENSLGQIKTQRIPTDPRDWKSGQKTHFIVSFKDLEVGSKFYLSLRLKVNGSTLRFANQGATDHIFLGSFHLRK